MPNTCPPSTRSSSSRDVVGAGSRLGSLPCLPVRHDLLVGSLDSLREEPITIEFRRRGVPTDLEQLTSSVQAIGRSGSADHSIRLPS